MAALTEEQRADAMRKLVQQMFVAGNTTADLTTAEALLMVGGMDDYIEANLTAINQAFPVSVRAKATMPQKALALAFAAMKRGGVI